MSQLALPSARPFLFFSITPTPCASSHLLVRSSRIILSPSYDFRRRFSSDPSIHPLFFSPLRSSSFSYSYIPFGKRKKNNSDSRSCHPLEAPWRLFRAGITAHELFPSLLPTPQVSFLCFSWPLVDSSCHLKERRGKKSHAVISVDTLGSSHARTHAWTGKGMIRFPATGRKNTAASQVQQQQQQKPIFCRALSSLAP